MAVTSGRKISQILIKNRKLKCGREWLRKNCGISDFFQQFLMSMSFIFDFNVFWRFNEF
jgi:hypothetical protein